MADAPTVGAWPARADVERRLEELVAAYEFEVVVLVPVVGAAVMIAGSMGVLPRRLAFDPMFLLAGTAVMRLPLVAGVAPLVDRRSAGLLVVLAAYTYAIEYVGVTTGWPYGEFSYVVELGPTIAGVPLGLPLFFVPLALNAVLLVDVLLGERAGDWRVRVPAAVAVVLAVDLVLDPGAVALGFWTYGGGAFYGVPASNYAGWLLSGTVAVAVLDRAFDHRAVRARHANCGVLLYDFASFVVLWGVVALAYGNWIPVLVAALIGAGIAAAERRRGTVGPAN